MIIGPFNPGMTRLAGEIADGVLLAWAPLDELAERVALVHEGAERAGRDPASVEIGLYVQAYAGPRVDDAIERFRRLVLEYAVRPTHRAAFVGSFPEIDRATALWEQRAGAARRSRSSPTRPCTACRRSATRDSSSTGSRRCGGSGSRCPSCTRRASTSSDPSTSAGTISAVAAAYRRAVRRVAPPERSETWIHAAMLWEIEQIKQLKARYFRGVDAEDWDLFRSVFTEDVRTKLPGTDWIEGARRSSAA